MRAEKERSNQLRLLREEKRGGQVEAWTVGGEGLASWVIKILLGKSLDAVIAL